MPRRPQEAYLPDMLYAAKIAVTTPWLGERNPDKTGVRRFNKLPNGDIKISQHQWRDALLQAGQDLSLNVNMEDVQPPMGVRAGCTQLYTRTYNRVRKETFESIQPGAFIKFELLVRSDCSEKQPGQPSIHRALEHIGKWIGLSPWGTKFHFGFFTVIHVTPLKFRPPVD